MNDPWAAVDAWFDARLSPNDSVLDAALEASAGAGLPPHQVSAAQGKMLHLFAQMCRAQRVLEIGTLGGYSTIWLARALPTGGSLITLEADPKHAEVARENVARAGLSDVVEVRMGRALDTLPQLEGPFDLIFIDADKPSNEAYFEHALRLSRIGTAIVVDNVVRDGKVIDAESSDASVLGVRRLVERLAREPRVRATAIQTVGAKGWDGFVLAIVMG